MSNFGEYSSRGQFGSTGGGQRTGDSEYIRLSNCVSNNVQQLTNNVANMQKFVEKIGTSEDTPSLRDKLQRTEQTAQKLAKDTNSFLKQLMYLDGDTPTEKRQRKMQMDKLRENFTAALNNFQQCQRRAAEKEKESVTRARAISMGQSSSVSFKPIGGYGENSALVSFDKTGGGSGQIQVQDEAEVSLELIEERERAIRQLETDIVGVNEIFRDLATMVHEQGEMIDSIEANVESAAVHVEDGNVQLEKARHYQKASRKKMCCLLVVLVVVAGAIGLIIYFTVGKKKT